MKPRPTELPILETERLLLRPMCQEDVAALFVIYGDPEVMCYADDEPFSDEATVATMLRSVAMLLAAGESLEWAIVERAAGQLVGTCGLHGFDEVADTVEVGCLLRRAVWGRGFMGEALQALFRYARDELKVGLLRADIDQSNLRSIHLFRKLGFVYTRDTFYERKLV